MKTVFALPALSLSFSAQADLGETEQELTARYGPVVISKTEPDSKALGFQFGKYMVLVHCRDGKSVREIYWTLDPDFKLSEDAALGIATKVAGAKTWVALPVTTPNQKQFKSNPAGFYAKLERVPEKGPRVLITTEAESRRLGAAQQKKQSEAPKGSN